MQGRRQSEDIDVHVRIILKHILKKQEAKCNCTDLVQHSDELQADFQRCDGLPGRIKGGEFLIGWVTISFRRRTPPPSSRESVRARFVPRSAHACCMSWNTLICFSSTEFGWRQTSWRDGPRPWGDTRIISGRLGTHRWGNGTIYLLKSDSVQSGRSHNKALHLGMFRNDM